MLTPLILWILMLGRKVGVLYDEDDAGRKGAEKIAKQFRKNGVKYVRVIALLQIDPDGSTD